MNQKNDDQNLKPERIQGTEKAAPEGRQETNGRFGIAVEINHGHAALITVDATGVTVRLGNPLAAAVTASS